MAYRYVSMADPFTGTAHFVRFDQAEEALQWLRRVADGKENFNKQDFEEHHKNLEDFAADYERERVAAHVFDSKLRTSMVKTEPLLQDKDISLLTGVKAYTDKFQEMEAQLQHLRLENEQLNLIINDKDELINELRSGDELRHKMPRRTRSGDESTAQPAQVYVTHFHGSTAIVQPVFNTSSTVNTTSYVTNNRVENPNTSEPNTQEPATQELPVRPKIDAPKTESSKTESSNAESSKSKARKTQNLPMRAKNKSQMRQGPCKPCVKRGCKCYNKRGSCTPCKEHNTTCEY